MNKVGMFYNYWSTEWMVDFPATAKRISGLGFDIMEISLSEFHNLPDAKKRELKAVADDLELTVMCCIGLKYGGICRTVRQTKKWTSALVARCSSFVRNWPDDGARNGVRAMSFRSPYSQGYHHGISPAREAPSRPRADRTSLRDESVR
ncbi:hypothetical protein [Caballeronia sp. ATUFL_M2_KS44]|uniref:hypothetical protein n=1 Tax=Caballeronia sp. ATUFL_M2_KS44 TaxID=2921767 RepID=UPI002028B4A1|nr:hypothetical protein [Caballeronia sp. ATUFL_M2_KS44]